MITWCYKSNCNEVICKVFYYNDCVPRGCICNAQDIEHDGEPNKTNC